MLLDEISAYWNLRADGYSDSIHRELAGEVGKEFQNRFARFLPEGEGLKCLDVGCGPGFFTMLLAQAGHQVTAADYSPEMLEYASRNCKERNLLAEFVRADAQNLQFEDETYDFVCSRNLIWNLEQPEQAYKEWYRVLKPGGRLFIFDGNHYLYYYDDDYRKAREYTHATQGSEHPHLKGVNPAPIDNIARNLPLSKKLRPDWDQEALQKVGFTILETERFYQKYVDMETKEEKELVHSFIVCAEKTTFSSGCQSPGAQK